MRTVPAKVKIADFNLTPEDPGYSLLVGDQIIPSQEELLAHSRVVHASIDPDGVPIAESKETKNDEDDGAEQDPDRVIVNARMATPADGLLSTEELVEMVRKLEVANLESSYHTALGIAKISGDSDIRTFGDRATSIPPTRQGRYEPEWTSYTHFWKTVLGLLVFLRSLSTSEAIVPRLHLRPGSSLMHFKRSRVSQATYHQGYGAGPSSEGCMW